MKRLLSILIALTVGLAVKATVVTSIGSVTDFQNFAASVNNGDNYTDVSVSLTADIDLDGVDWTPIGTSAHPFNGRFYGEDHKISNLTVNTSGLYAGLFGYVAGGAEVKEVHIMSGTIAVATNPGVNASYHGGIAGYNLGSINKCSNSATVSGSNYEHARIGGIVGENGKGKDHSGVIRNCYNLGEVYSGLTNVYIGGIVGYNYGYVYNCFMRSNVLKGNPSSSSPYPLYGNNTGTVTGCFYAGGAATDVSLPIALADDSDNSTTLSGDNLGSGKNVLLSGRTLYTDGGWNTLCLPFSIPATVSSYSPIAGATVKTLSSSSFSDGVLTLTFDYASSIEAGKPYIVKWETLIADNLSNPVFMGVEVSNTTNDVTCDLGDGKSIVFKGTQCSTTFTEDDNTKLFVGTDNKLNYPKIGARIGAFRAYFQLNGLTVGDPASQIKEFRLNFGEDSETGLSEELRVKSEESDNVYDLSGRRINSQFSTLNSQLPKGIYIVNGKKVAIK